ncbi:MAG: hypothetical protein ABSB88_16140 [Bryobacteraceae bacterium]
MASAPYGLRSVRYRFLCGKESRIAILADGARLPISRSGYARLLEAMGDSQGNRNTTL